MRTAGCHDDLIGVGIDDQVGVMGDYDCLPALFGSSEALDQFIEDRLRIEVLFGLIDY